MSYDKDNGRLSIGDRNSNDPKGITLMEISRCLRDHRRDKNGNIDLGMMCTSPNIKIWAKNKPVRLKKFEPLTEEDRRSVNYGLDLYGAFDDTAEGLIAKAIANKGTFGYLRPRGGLNEPYRQLDFDGYWHQATAPYICRVHHNTKGDSYAWVEIYLSDKAELRLTDLMPTDIEDFGEMKLALLFRPKKATTGVLVKFPTSQKTGSYITLNEIEYAHDNAEGAPIGQFEFLPSEAGDYDMAFALTEGDEDNIDAVPWVYVPDGFFSFSYDPNYTSFIWEYSEDYWVRGVDANGKTIRDTETDAAKVEISTMITVDEDYTSPITGDVRLRVGNYSSDGYFETTQEIVRSFYISPGSSDNFDVVFTNFDVRTIDGIYLEADVQYKDANADEYETAYFDFINNEVKWNYQEPVTVWDVQEINPN